MERNIKSTGQIKGVMPLLVLLKCVLFAYLFTGVLLLILALILYRFGLTEKTVSAVIIAVYIAAAFLAGFLAGKKIKSRRFLWGFAAGCMYFLVLTLISLAVNGAPDQLANSFLTTFILCAGGGMLGGMLS